MPLLELSKVVSDVLSESPRLVVLGDISIHTEAICDRSVQDFMVSMITMDLS